MPSEHTDLPADLDALARAVHEAGGNLSKAARILGTPRPTLVSRLRRHDLNHVTSAARAERRAADLACARKVLDQVPPSDRVRALLLPSDARALLLEELAQRDDLDADARARLRAEGRLV